MVVLYEYIIVVNAMSDWSREHILFGDVDASTEMVIFGVSGGLKSIVFVKRRILEVG